MNNHIINILISCTIFIITYVFIILDKVERSIAAMAGAILMILFKIISQENAFKEIDYNTLGLLISMMVIVMIIKRTGLFEYLAIRVVKLSKGEPIKIIIFLSVITGLISGVLDNVTTIMLIIPLTFDISKDLRINPIPFVISEVFASNIGGTATLIGDPPNIMIGSSAGLSFMDFLVNNAAIAIMLLFLFTYLFVIIYRKKLSTTKEAKIKAMAMDEGLAIKDKRLLRKGLIIMALTIIGLMLHGVLHYESATVAIAGAVMLLCISGINPERIFHEVEWNTIFFFVGLFILVGGIKETGVIKILAEGVIGITHGNVLFTAMAILWFSAIASAFVDNIPFVATMIPMIKDLGVISGMNLMPLWLALSLGACFGGNGTIVGASANVIACSMAEDRGHKISYKYYFRIAFPLTFLSIVCSSIYIYILYFK